MGAHLGGWKEWNTSTCWAVWNFTESFYLLHLRYDMYENIFSQPSAIYLSGDTWRSVKSTYCGGTQNAQLKQKKIEALL